MIGAQGCYYPVRGYGSVWRRVLSLGIDVAVLMAIAAGLTWLLAANGIARDAAATIVAATLVVAAYVYFVEIERTRFGTLGMRLAGLRIVDLGGHRPSRMDMLLRLGLAGFWPIDLFWIGGDDNRQSLRDKFAGTYVIRRGARPEGWSPCRYALYFFDGMTWTFREVQR